jgi:GntR family transcriptional regulator
MSMQNNPVLQPAPLYLQLAGMLRKQIERGELRGGEGIPTEAELGERYAISRATVRQALGLLVEEGLIIRQRGRGSIVAPQHPLNYMVAELRGFTEALMAKGLAPKIRLLTHETITPPPEIAGLLGLDSDASALFFERLAVADDGPILLDSGYIPTRLEVELSAEALANQPIYRLLEAQLGLPIIGLRQAISAVSAGPRESALLAVPPGAALLQITRLAYVPRDRPVLYGLGLFRADRYQERLWLRRPGAPSAPPVAIETELFGEPSE